MSKFKVVDQQALLGRPTRVTPATAAVAAFGPRCTNGTTTTTTSNNTSTSHHAIDAASVGSSPGGAATAASIGSSISASSFSQMSSSRSQILTAMVHAVPSSSEDTAGCMEGAWDDVVGIMSHKL